MQGSYIYALTEMLGADGESTELATFDRRLSESELAILKQELQAASSQGELDGWSTEDVIITALNAFGERTGVIGLMARRQVIHEIIY